MDKEWFPDSHSLELTVSFSCYGLLQIMGMSRKIPDIPSFASLDVSSARLYNDNHIGLMISMSSKATDYRRHLEGNDRCRRFSSSRSTTSGGGGGGGGGGDDNNNHLYSKYIVISFDGVAIHKLLARHPSLSHLGGYISVWPDRI